MKDPMLIREPATARQKQAKPDRSKLMEQHAEARARRDAAALESVEFRAAAEDIARIEVAIAKLEEPPA
jgi:ribosomal protein L15E